MGVLLARRGFAVLLGLTVLTACQDTSPADPTAKLEPVERLVLISIDTLRADRLGLYGHGAAVSPNLDDLAQRSLVFEHAVAVAPVTLPSHATLLTGLRPVQHGVHDNATFKLVDSHRTLAETLHARGMRTAAVIGSLALESQFGLDQGFEVYDDAIRPHEDPTESSYAERSAEDVTDRAIELLDGWDQEPFFLFVHYYDPHRRWNAPEPFRGRFPDDGYDAEIAYTDAQVGRLLDALAQRGVADRTAVIVTSDHGESLGEFGESSHAYFIYQATQRVPLVVHVPGMQTRRNVSSVVGAVDVVPTALSLLGIERPENGFPGRDLSTFWQTDALPGPERFVYAQSVTPTKLDCNPLMGVVGDRWKYVHTARPELYDLSEDPGEQRNRFAAEPERVAKMKSALDAILSDHTAGTGYHDVEPEMIEILASLGYVGKPTDDTLRIDQSLDDPKDCIELFNKYGELMVLTRARQFDRAHRAAKSLLEARSNMTDVYRYLGLIAFELRKWDEAIAQTRLYLALSDQDLKGRDERTRTFFHRHLADAHLVMGVSNARLGNLDRALNEFDAALEFQPGLPAARFNRGLTLQKLGRDADAIEQWRSLLQDDPTHARAAASLAELGVEPL